MKDPTLTSELVISSCCLSASFSSMNSDLRASTSEFNSLRSLTTYADSSSSMVTGIGDIAALTDSRVQPR